MSTPAQDRIRGCLIGGAVGDALGYAIEFLPEELIFEKYGPNGLTEYDMGIFDKALISDDTQNIIFELLGHEDGLKLIEIDVCHDNWLFYRHSNDAPARCVAYLKQCGLSNPQILELVSEYGYILNLFGKISTEAKVDSIIDRFLYEWVKHHGPCYDGLTLEEIDFLIHGPGKLES